MPKSASRKHKVVEQHRVNGRLYGAICESQGGQRYYLARRRHDQIFRGGESSVSDAITKGKACWAVDILTLSEMKSKGIGMIGIHVRETGDEYFTQATNFDDPNKTYVRNYSKRGGSLQRYLPLGFFTMRPGVLKIRA